MVQQSYSSRLYLAKGKDEIYVDFNQLLQHQVEGIRFLYRQFKKKKSGVMLNDPASSGKTHQVVLFLKAIKGLLTKPILILCSGHEKDHWLTHFIELTDFGNGVLVEPSNLNLKRMSVCIDTKRNVASLVSHKWSVVVVDDDSAVNEILKRAFKTEYKIWITSVDMKANLEAFYHIHGWLRPEEKEDVKKMISKTKETDNSLDELLLLDAVMEDVVLRRLDGLSPFKKENTVQVEEINKTKKNKDASGTKIKRSTRLTSKKASISNVSTSAESKLTNVDDKSENTEVFTDENKSTINIEPITNNKLKESDLLEIVDINNDTKLDGRKSDNKNDFSYEGNDVQMKNDETPDILIEPSIATIDDEPKVIDTFNSLNQEVNSSEDKLMTIVAKNELPEDKEVKNKSSPYKSIDEAMRETEQKALQKFKGSLLDSIF